MTMVFLSHSSKDKENVRRLAEALKERSISVWLDEWEIDVGESITQRITEGLSNARFVAVWLSPHAVASGWVTKEWQHKIYNEISSKAVIVLPLLAEDCDIPTFLMDKKYADFRLSFRKGFSELMRTLSRQNVHVSHIPQTYNHFSITALTNGFLKDLDNSIIPFPTLGNLNPIRALKQIARSGKLLRLESMQPPIAIRSIYDHILSIAHSADCLFDILKPSIHHIDPREIARTIVCHDLCEILLGDIPQYTPLNQTKRRRANISAQIRLAALPNGEPERIANEFISMFLNESERLSLKKACDTIASNTEEWKFVYALDKFDPILAVWRYIHVFRNTPSFMIDEFLARMKHFFENPNVQMCILNSIADTRMIELVSKLQNPSLAKRYFEDASFLTNESLAFPSDLIQRLIEGRHLEFILKSKGRIKPYSQHSGARG